MDTNRIDDDFINPIGIAYLITSDVLQGSQF
jgi:hypothetical protein